MNLIVESPVPRIEFADVRYIYHSGVVALAGISLAIPPGQSVAIVGENGAGKTTLAKHLNGLLRPTAGQVWIGSRDTQVDCSPAELAHDVGYVFQRPEDQIFCRTVREEVAFGPRNLAFPTHEIGARVADALAASGLDGLADVHPYDLHAAQRKWVAIAGVLAMATPVVVLDEPSAGQDAVGVARLVALCRALTAAGRTVIVITHDIEFAADVVERVVVLRAGAVVVDGPAGEVLASPELEETAGIAPPQLLQLGRALGLRRGEGEQTMAMAMTVGEFVVDYCLARVPRVTVQ